MKTENEIKRDELQAHSVATSKRIEELDALIEAEKKPKFKHSDYGLWRSEPARYQIIQINGSLHLFCDKGQDLGGIENFNMASFTRLGNTLDDLKSLQENVTEFRVNRRCFKFHSIATARGRINMTTAGCWMDIETADEISLKLRQLVAEAKRQK